MSEEPPMISILDARLAEIDRRLGTIQIGLTPPEPGAESEPGAGAESEPGAGAEPPAPSPVIELPVRVRIAESAAPAPVADGTPVAGADELIAELRELAGAHAGLLGSMRELVSAYELAIARLGSTAAPPVVGALSLSAGPLASIEALRGFERALSELPEVRGVEVRGYEGGDRAIVDVHLSDLTS